MTSYSHGPGYSTRPAYSTGQGYSTGPSHSTEPAYSTESNGVRPYINKWGQTRHGSPPGGNYCYVATGDNWSIRHSSPPRQTFEPARTYGSYPNQSGYNRPPGYGTAINMIANGSGHNAKPNRGSLLAAARPVRRDGRLNMPMDESPALLDGEFKAQGQILQTANPQQSSMHAVASTLSVRHVYEITKVRAPHRPMTQAQCPFGEQPTSLSKPLFCSTSIQRL
ncbi:hypothetical protein ACFX13_033368 [Malus domestica]